MQPTRQRTEETVEARFPTRGDQPSNEVVVDPTLADAPDIGHPHNNRRPEDEVN